VYWKPQQAVKVSGKVVGSTIYIYNEKQKEAVDTLKHEYLDCILTRRLVNPLVTLVNTFVKLTENEIYNEKERIVNGLSKLV